jgi:flavodoxin
MFLFLSLGSAAVLGPDSKVLICWFSRSGLTKRAVDKAQSLLNADVYEIQTGSSYTGLVGGMRSVLHMITSEKPPITGPLPDLTKYDAIIVATPVWSFKPAPPVMSFLSAVDFAGKPVIPLATCKSNARRFLDVFKATLGTRGRFVSAEVFYDVGGKSDAALEEIVKNWVKGL